MKTFLLAIAALQILHCLGVPNPEDALRAAIIKLNEISEISHLCGIVSSTVTDLSPTGKLSYNVDLAFAVQETVCSKNSGLEFDDSSCPFRPARIAETANCRSRVKYMADEVLDVDVECHGFRKGKGNGNSMERVKVNGGRGQSEPAAGTKSHTKPPKRGKGHRRPFQRFIYSGVSSELINSSEELRITSEELSHESSSKLKFTSEESSFGASREYNDDSRVRHRRH
ncbi:secreted phosphoprotein 24-like [Hypanus sabinus]|uniref:secreted phosphoprotein 24-like n=1 Tax=Hypanus sabinus TaxID=79690 RepID=UPI0028C4CFE4|nr:secreted phosphoprotein 24-like [Hypanus sabinus]XP_059823071.1 secreted phosphoprotein 24-like [Hypanus sabinus]XP_059823072.1 secreted phosphoprotein 24-like [Hypanus sabinus]